MNFLNIIGLILNIFGVTLLFFWANPQPDLSGDVDIGLEDNHYLEDVKMAVRECGEHIQKKRKVYEYISKFGLFLILIGFIFQFIAALQLDICD